MLELDDQARIISYEEYTPYGSTSYQAVRSQTETPKRYRFAGKERDEESGLYYYGARYYASHWGRWISCDPHVWQAPAPSAFAAFANSPVRMTDPDGREPKIANRYKDMADLKKDISVKYSPDEVAVSDTKKLKLGTNTLSEDQLGQDEIKKAQSGSNIDKILVGIAHPGAAWYRKELEGINKMSYVKQNASGTAIGHISDQMYSHLSTKPTGPTVMKGKDKVTYGDATKNMLLHVFGQSAITTVFGRGAADYAGDTHERDQGSLITGAFKPGEIRDAIDNYSDMVNNLYGQDIGERVAAKLGITSSTVWTPALTAKYVNAVQGEIAKEMKWKFTPFAATDPEIKKFSALLNEVQGTTPAAPAAPPHPTTKVPPHKAAPGHQKRKK